MYKRRNPIKPVSHQYDLLLPQLDAISLITVFKCCVFAHTLFCLLHLQKELNFKLSIIIRSFSCYQIQ